MNKMMMKNDQIEISRDALRGLLGCAAYAFVKNGKYLYVGASKKGIRRAIEPDHVAASAAITDGADLIVIPCIDHTEALRRERRMMERYQPLYNRTLERPKLPVLDQSAAKCLNPKCLHRWTRRTLSPARCPKCGHRLELQT